MDARGLVALIVTLNELAAMLGLLVGSVIAILGLLLLRATPFSKRILTVLAFSLGGGLITFAVTSHLFHTRAFDVEVVRVGE